MVRLVESPAEVSLICDELRLRGNRIGFVPTMGALHQGHYSLIGRSSRENDITVVSIFVNPIQFNDREDFEKYPRDLDSDIAGCEEAGADFVFAPSTAQMYPDPDGAAHCWVDINGPLVQTLCGLSRPGHFRGVVTVCCKLFNAVRPHVAYFGQKDYQQFLVIRQLVRDLNMPLDLEMCPIVREGSGLAMSSRNERLSAKGRKTAAVLHFALAEAREDIMTGERDPNRVLEKLATTILDSGMNLDYAIIADPDSLEDIRAIGGPVLIAVAAEIEGVRLIDNELIGSLGRP